MYKNHPGHTGFEDMKVSWRAAEVWHCERPEKAIAEVLASAAVNGPGLKGSCKELRLGTENGACERLLVKLSCS